MNNTRRSCGSQTVAMELPDLPKRTFLINEDFDDAAWETTFLPIMIQDQKKSKKPMTILVNSVGGNVYSTTPAVEIIKNIKTPTKIVILGYAYSLAALFILAAKHNPWIKVYAYSFSSFLLHSGSTAVSGTTTAVKDYQKFADKYEKLIKDFMIENSSIDEEEYEKIERQEKYYTAQEMLENGFIDEIIPFGTNLFDLLPGEGVCDKCEVNN